jgi:hypothetical protein
MWIVLWMVRVKPKVLGRGWNLFRVLFFCANLPVPTFPYLGILQSLNHVFDIILRAEKSEYNWRLDPVEIAQLRSYTTGMFTPP